MPRSRSKVLSRRRLIDEGPLGEWTGYYAGGHKKEPAIRVESMMHRDDPVLLAPCREFRPTTTRSTAAPTAAAPCGTSLEAAGVPEVKGVWSHENRRQPLWLNVSIKQMYAGHFEAGPA